MSFPPANEMFQFAGFASYTYEFSAGYRQSGGFPHSEIPGSKRAPNSPGLIAECHVLHRLSVPRHPPNALLTLETTSMRRDKPKAHGRLISATNTASSVLPTPEDRKTNEAKRPIHAVKEPDVKRHDPDAGKPGRREMTFHTRHPPRADAIIGGSPVAVGRQRMVEVNGFEPMTSCLQSRRSPT